MYQYMYNGSFHDNNILPSSEELVEVALDDMKYLGLNQFTRSSIISDNNLW